MLIKLGNRVIGNLDYEYRMFDKKVRSHKHLFKKFDAWGIDAQYFTDVLLPSNYTIRVFDLDEETMYKVSAKIWKKNAQYFHFKTEDEDHRAQTFLSRRHFVKYNMKQNEQTN